MSFIARVSYTANGSTDTFSFSFPYILSSHVKAFVNGTEDNGITFPTTSTVQLSSTPANGAVVLIKRATPSDARLVDFQDGSVLTSADLDQSADQNFYIAQETTDNVDGKMGLDTSDRFDALSKRIINVANPVDNNDAVNKTYLENTWLSSANKTALTSVNSNISNINAVNSNASNINSAVSNATNINTVATNIGSVNTVATDITKVIAVANDLAEAVSEVETVADDLNEATSEIDTVATHIANVNTVGTNIANVNTVAGISSTITAVNSNSSNINAVNTNSSNINTVAGQNSNITTLAGISANITTVAGINANVTTVAGISGDVTAVANIASDVTAVENIKTNVTTVAGISSNVTSVAGVSANVTTLAPISANITTVAGVASSVTTVAGISSDVTAVANIASDVAAVENIAANVTTVAGANSNITAVAGAITNINNVGGAITNVNNVGGSIANVNTVATNIAGVNSFASQYRVSSSDPTSSLDAGDLAYNTTGNVLKFYNGSAWVTITSGGITDLAQDSTPQLGGNLDLNGSNITGTGGIPSANLTGTIAEARLPASALGSIWESKSANFTAEARKNYFIDTSSNTVSATLPSSGTAGDEIHFLDVSGTFDTNNLTVLRNSHKIQGATSDLTVATERAGFTLVYLNATQGWLLKDV